MIESASLRRAAVFHAVAEAGGIAAAARRIGKSAPAVHADLRRFERDMGVALTEPFGRTLRLTPAGRTMHQTIGRALADIQRAGSHIRDQGGAALPLRIGAVTGFGRYVLAPRVLPALGTDRPIELRMGSHDALLALMLAAEIDLLLTYRPVTSVPLESETVAEEELVLVCAGCSVPPTFDQLESWRLDRL
jgi:DNA-binding transcriptional LysR family regulator